jgi:4-hydroxybenzoate polyprenyltransferase
MAPAKFVSSMAKSFIWFFFYGYHFDILNQIVGVQEDTINNILPAKRNRPLASGTMSMMGGKVRYAVSGALFLVASLIMGGISLSLQACSWMVSVYLYNIAGWANHFATKNYVIMSTGSSSLLLAARLLAGDVTSSILPPLLSACYVGMTMDIQDLRDEVGDRAIGRKTTSVVLGVKTARTIWGVQMLTASLLFAHLIRKGLSLWPDAVIGTVGLGVLTTTLRGNNAQDDHQSYINYTIYAFLVYCRSAFWAHGF